MTIMIIGIREVIWVSAIITLPGEFHGDGADAIILLIGTHGGHRYIRIMDTLLIILIGIHIRVMGIT